MPRRGGCWDTFLTRVDGPGRSPSRCSRRGTSIIPFRLGSGDWVAHLEAGELPAPCSGARRRQWLPARQADELRSNWKNAWVIPTEHFEIKSDVPLGEAIEFARRLEAFYDLFFTLMADVVGDNLPLARRFRTPS